MTSGLRVAVQPAKPALPIRFLYEELPNFYLCSAHKFLQLFVLLFLIEYVILSWWVCFKSM